ncbi:MAG: hypothetical protein ACD_21C00091G0002 [uncultured bacterium]|nr:MAG: hypothetical protein ACD_21C00091G0002 [uncultured bacterium]
MATFKFVASPANSTPFLKPLKAITMPLVETALKMVSHPVREVVAEKVPTKLAGINRVRIIAKMVSKITKNLKTNKIKLKRTKPR